MKSLIKFKKLDFNACIVLYNVHFWIILSLFFVITVLYYNYGALPYFNRASWIRQLLYFEIVYRINGILLFIPFFYASVVFWWKGALFVWSISVLIMLPRIINLSLNPASLIQNILYMTMPLMLVLFVTMELQWRNTVRINAHEREEARQIYMAQIFKAQEDERRRIAQELHDETIQSLMIMASSARGLMNNEIIKTRRDFFEPLKLIQDVALNLSNDMRRLSLNLRPAILDDMGLLAALNWLIDNLQNDSNIVTQLIIKGEARALKSEEDVMLFRIVQEAMNNIKYHSKATKVEIMLEFLPSQTKLLIWDNGVGFELSEKLMEYSSKGKLGLVGMRQRAKAIGGDMVIYSEPGRGTTLAFEFNV